MTSRPGPELETLIGEEAFLRLAEAFGGTRLYVPSQIPRTHDIARAIGVEAASVLAERLAPDVIRVPLAREQIARHYKAVGESHAQIARRLRITEKGVDRMLGRLGKGAPAPQPDLFDR